MSSPSGSTPRSLWPLALLAVLALAAFLRLDAIGTPSLWLDEILHVEKTREAADEPWLSWMRGVSADRENGSLYYAGQLLGRWLFDDELGVRIIPALAGIATVVAIFFASFLATGSRRVALVSAALLATSPLHVYYSREGRPYAAVMLLVVLLLWLALRGRRPWTQIAIYGSCIGTAYLGAVTVPVLISCAMLAGFEWLRSRQSGHLLLGSVAALTIGFVLFPTAEKLGGAVGALNHTARWEITSPFSMTGFDRLLASLSVSGVDRGTSNTLSFLFLGLAVWGGISLARKRPRQAFWVAGLCVLPIGGWLAALVALDHWYNVRYTSAGLPAFLLLVSIGLVDLWNRGWQRLRRGEPGRHLSWVSDALLVGALVWMLAPAWRTARAEPLEKPDWRGVAELIGTLGLPQEPVIARGPWAEVCIRHYLRELDLAIEVFSANYDPARAAQLTERNPRAWVLSAGYRETPEFKAWTQDLDPILRRRLENLQLFYYPDFSTFLSEPGRVENLAAFLAQNQESEPRQEFAQSELLLGTGWSYPERAPDGMTFRWANGSRSELALPAPSEGGLRELRLRLMPFPSPDRPPQSVEVTVNSEPLARFALEPGWNEISVPRFEGRRTVDLIVFDFAWSQSPRELDPASGDPRQLTVAFDFVEAIPALSTSPSGRGG